MKFKYDQDDEEVFVSVQFLEDQEGDAFARRFDHKKPPGLTPLGV